MKVLNKMVGGLLLGALCVSGLVGCNSNPEQPSGPVIGLSLADLKEERWKYDRDFFKAQVEALGGHVIVQDAGGDARVQIEQCRNMILQGIQALVVVPKNADAARPIVEAAHAKGLPVISYDRLITNAPVDVYLSFDNFKVGAIQAQAILDRAPKGKYLLLGGDPADQNAFMLREGQMQVLQPALERGDIEIVANPFCDKWLRSEATRYTEDNLAKHPDLVAIVASNDGTAGGAIAALKAKGLAGEVLVSGQDADLEACRNLVKGFQTVTVYKPIRQLAEMAAHLAVNYASKTETSQALLAQARVTRINNGHGNVKTLFLTPLAVTRENLEQTVVEDGYHSRAALYDR